MPTFSHKNIFKFARSDGLFLPMQGILQAEINNVAGKSLVSTVS